MFGFFKRDYRHYVEKGEKHLLQGRYVDAKFSFNDALDFVDISTSEGVVNKAELLKKISDINNKLAELNLQEAESSMNAGNSVKADEHLQMVLELAEDVMLREKAELLVAGLQPTSDSNNLIISNSGCSSCNCSHDQHEESATWVNDADHNLTQEERFELLIAPLPASLPEAYASLGKEFACAYVAIHDGDDVTGLRILETINADRESDIVCHELGLIKHRQGDIPGCERYLKRAIELNPMNALSYMALVHLMIDTERPQKAVPLLDHMIDSGLLPGQAQVILGDLQAMQGDDSKAIDSFSKALKMQGVARDAAERLVALLVRQGRLNEAEFVRKQYLKKCC